MTRTGIILSLLMVGLVAASAGSKQQQQKQLSETYEPKAFRAGYEYVFDYNGQIAIGQIAPSGQSIELSKYAEDGEQKAATRIQCQSRFTFNSEHTATLRLDKCRVGQLNEPLGDAQRVQPMAIFQTKKIDEAKQRQLQLPCDFRYVDGVVTTIRFHADDQPWSKNVKRAVLNLIQVNLKQQQQSVVEEGNEDEQLMTESEKFFTAKAFTVPETTLEGECLTTYTINSNSKMLYRRNGQQNDDDEDDDESKQQQLFNVTKSIGFKQCKRIADIAFGSHAQPDVHPQCIECMQQQWSTNANSQQQQFFYYPNACEQLCNDPKLIGEKLLDRSTVMRFVMAGRPESAKECAIQRSELLSQYVYKSPSLIASIKSADKSIGGGAMRAIVAAELQFRQVKSASSTAKVQLKDECPMEEEEKKKDCSMLYDNTEETLEKRFQMFGDTEFDRASGPFAHVHGKVDRALNAYRRIVQSAADKSSGLESEAVTLMSRLIATLRMCTVDELEKIDAALKQQHTDESSQLERAKQLFADTLAIAGTRNAVYVLAKQISGKQCSPIKAAQIISSLTGLPSPSTAIVDLIIDVCKSDVAKKSATLRQSCLLTSGALVGELCRFKSFAIINDNNNNNNNNNGGQLRGMPYGRRTGFNADAEMCPLNKKKAYKQFFVEQLESAQTTYEKIVALKAIGNAALDITVAQPLEAIVRGQQKGAASPLLRMQAIDALRRVAAQMPRKIQRLLLPIFQNVRERPEVRILAFSTIMSATRPSRPIVDQLVYTLSKEQNADVQSYVYTMIKALARSPIVAQQEIVKHLKAALKLANVDDRQMARAGVKSVRAQLPLFFGASSDDGVLIKLMSVLNGRSKKSSSQQKMEVGHLAASIHSIIDGQLYGGNDGVGIGATFANADHWARNLLNAMLIQQSGSSSTESSYNSKTMRSQRSGADNAKLADQELRDIASTLGIQKRKDEYDNEEIVNAEKNGFAMLCFRVGNVDRVVVPFAADMLPAALKSVLSGRQSGKKLSIAELRQLVETTGLFDGHNNGKQQSQHYRILGAAMLAEQRAIVPTAVGLPLKIGHSAPAAFAVDAQMKSPSFGGQSLKTHFNVHASGSAYQTTKMDAWLPIAACGVKSQRVIEFHAPLNGDAEISMKEGLKLALKTPTVGQTPLKTRLIGIHTLAATFTRDFDAKTHWFREPKLKSIHSAHYADAEESGSAGAAIRHWDVNRLVGEHAVGVPLRVNGHFYLPTAVAGSGGMVDYLAALFQIASTSENHLHITFEPTDDTPREIVLRAEASAFQKLSGKAVEEMAQQLRDFYAHKSQRFQSMPMMENNGEEDLFTDEYHQQNNERFNRHLDQFDNTKTAYKHSVKLSAQAIGGRKQARAELDLQAACDAKHKLCKLNAIAKRTPMLAAEQEWWTLKCDAAAVMPDYVSSVEHLQSGGSSTTTKKNQKFMLHAKTEWGCAQRSKQSVEIRVEGQNKMDKQLQKLIDNIAATIGNDDEEQQSALKSQKQLKRDVAFINHFSLVADYKLQQQQEQQQQPLKVVLNRAFEALKTYHFWSATVDGPSLSSSSSAMMKQPQCEGSTCRMYATLVIDPLAQRFANLSIRTPTERVHIPRVALPIRIRPMSLVRVADSETHSVAQALSRLSSMGGSGIDGGAAECKAYADRVSTFDGIAYVQPITTDCYAALAKDCGEQATIEQQPRFVVLMKSLTKDGKQKKVKVVTSENIVECQAVYNNNNNDDSFDGSSSKKIECTVNGQVVTAANAVDTDGLLEYNNDEQTSAIVRLAEQGVRVRFGCLCGQCDCQKAVVSYVDERYKRASCGLCGHYDDSTSGEWRSADDKPTDDLATFHRSYALRNAEECSAVKLDSFYANNQNKFRVINQKQQEFDSAKKPSTKFNQEEEEDEGLLADYKPGHYVDEDNEDDVVDGQKASSSKFYGGDNFNNNGQYYSSIVGSSEENDNDEDDDQGFFDFAGKKQQLRANKKKVIEPESQTRVIEYNHLICFSVQPVKRCPSGTVAAYKPVNQITQYDIEAAVQDNNNNGDDDNNEDQPLQQQQQKPKTNVKFACLSRSSSIARGMQHQAKRGVIVDVSGYSPNSVEQVLEPKSCIKINKY